MSQTLMDFEENLRGEIARQRSVIDGIRNKIDAMRRYDVAGMEKALEQLAAAGIEGARLENERRSLFAGFAQEFGGAAPETIKQVVARYEAGNPQLRALHAELKEVAIEAEELCRKSSHLIRHYKDVYTTALDRVFEAAGIYDPDSPDGRVTSGIVVNAEG